MYLLILWISIFSSSQLSEAKMLIVQERYQDAIDILEGMTDTRARYYEGWCHMRLGDCAQANPQFQQFISTYTGVGAEEWKAEAIANMGDCGSIAIEPPIIDDPVDDLPVTTTVDPIDTTTPTEPNEPTDDTPVSIWPVNKGGLKPTIVLIDKTKIWPEVKTGLLVPVLRPADSSIAIWPERPANKLLVKTNKVLESKIWPEVKKGLLVHRPAEGPVAIWPETPTNKLLVNTNTILESKIWPEVKNGLILNSKPSIKKPKTTTIKTEQKKKENKLGVEPENRISRKQQHYRILFSIEKSGDKTFLDLASLGPVTTEKTKSGYHIYYVGFFKELKEAKDALEKVVNYGYKAAEISEFGEEKPPR